MTGTSHDNDLILVGAIGAAHGVRGLVRLVSYTAEPEAIAAYGPLTDANGTARFRLSLAGGGRGGAGAGKLLARIEGVADRDAAARLAGTRLYVRRAQLPPPADAEEFYHADLIGLAVEDGAGRRIGTVAAVHDYGAGVSLEVAGPRGRVLMLPFSRAVVPVVDLAGRRLVARPPVEVEVPPSGHAARAAEGEGAGTAAEAEAGR